jgi:2-polyprenyl-6-methoxyphenol hydroxylase-like FAD-dependent oxidoreductase
MSEIDGTWNLEITTPMGLQRSTLELTRSGESVQGSATDERGSTAIREGRTDGEVVTFLLDVRRPFKMTLTFSLTVSGDTITGTSKPGRFPASPVQGVRSGAAVPATAKAAPKAAKHVEGQPQRLRVLIGGAGLAGLAAGIALAKRGHDVRIIDVGAGVEGAQIGISARAVDALHELGALEATAALANVLMVPVFTNQFDVHGERLPTPEFDVPARPDGLPAMIVVYRPLLWQVLEDAARNAGVEIQRPLSISTFAGDADGVDVTLSDGTVDRVDLLVGAEGVHSPTRVALFGESAAARYVGSMSLRWTVRDMEPGQGGFYHGPGGTMAIVGLMPGNMTYVASGWPMENRRVEPDAARQLLRAVLDQFDAPYLTRLRERLGDDEHVIARPYETVRIHGDWHSGRVIVIGDAAHATTPNLSSGGGMALEDGVVLGQEIGDGADLDAALASFVNRRRPRTDLVVDASLELMHLESSGAGEEAAMPVRMSAMAHLAGPY